MSQTPNKPVRPDQPGAPQTRRSRARWQRERERQRIVLIVAGGAIGLSLLAVLIGFLFENVWTPSRPVAQVGATTLSRRDYWGERRNEIARGIAQNLQLLTMFGNQFGDQFAGQTPTLNSQVPSIQTAPDDIATIDSWIDRQLILQGAAKMSIQASEGEIAQEFVSALALAFPPPITDTVSMTPTLATTTAALTPTDTISPTATGPTAAVTGTATVTPSGPTATATATHTPEPTATPSPTPLPDVALQQQGPILTRLYDAYINLLANSGGAAANLEESDFRVALRDQYERQVLTRKIEAQLIPEESFTPSTDPSNISLRHILIKVTTPISATEAEREAAFAERRPEAEALLTRLRNGADFATVAREESDDRTTGERGGELPGFDKTGRTTEGTQMDPAIVQAGLTLKEQEISDLIRTPFGWHIVQLVSRTVDSKADQLQAKRTTAFETWLGEQRAAISVRRFPEVTATPTPPPTGTPAPLPTTMLGGLPTPIPTDTTTLTATTTLLPSPSATTAVTALPTSPTTLTTTTPATPLPTGGPTAPVAVTPTPTATPRP